MPLYTDAEIITTARALAGTKANPPVDFLAELDARQARLLKEEMKKATAKHQGKSRFIGVLQKGKGKSA